jgi:hypothetical protein
MTGDLMQTTKAGAAVDARRLGASNSQPVVGGKMQGIR